MSQSTTILQVIHNGEMFGQEYLQKLIELESNGQDVTEEKTRFVILWMLIEALRRYYTYNFDSEGNPTDPTVDCLSDEQYNNLVRKIGEITEGKNYQLSDWILETGIWRGDGVWRSSGIWYAN